MSPNDEICRVRDLPLCTSGGNSDRRELEGGGDVAISYLQQNSGITIDSNVIQWPGILSSNRPNLTLPIPCLVFCVECILFHIIHFFRNRLKQSGWRQTTATSFRDKSFPVIYHFL